MNTLFLLPSPSLSILPSIPPLSIAFSRWCVDPSFLCVHRQTSRISLDTRYNSITKGSEVVCCLRSSLHPLSIGIIAFSWDDWLPALQFAPIQPSWIFDLRQVLGTFCKTFVSFRLLHQRISVTSSRS